MSQKQVNNNWSDIRNHIENFDEFTMDELKSKKDFIKDLNAN